jgi:hypothetical protein
MPPVAADSVSPPSAPPMMAAAGRRLRAGLSRVLGPSQPAYSAAVLITVYSTKSLSIAAQLTTSAPW